MIDYQLHDHHVTEAMTGPLYELYQELHPVTYATAEESRFNGEFEDLKLEVKEMTYLIIEKTNGKGYASKQSAHNALRAFKALNKEVINVQCWSHSINQNDDDGTYYVRLEPKTEEMFPSVIEPAHRVLYRTKADAKNDRPMFDARPKPKTQREIELEEEVAKLKKHEVVDNNDSLKEIERLKKELVEAKAEVVEIKNAAVEVFETFIDEYTKDNRFYCYDVEDNLEEVLVTASIEGASIQERLTARLMLNISFDRYNDSDRTELDTNTLKNALNRLRKYDEALIQNSADIMPSDTYEVECVLSEEEKKDLVDFF